MPMVLTDKVILVTGSSTGIGKAVAKRCVAEGAHVMLHGLNAEETRSVAETLNQPYAAGDLGQPAVSQRLIDATISQFGRIDGLVNNAAMTTRANLEETSAEFFDRVIGVNLRAPLLLIRAAVPFFRRQGNGVVVNIGSVNAYCGEPNLLAYSIAKGGLMTLTRNLADALAAENIRINQINPGWTLSENEIALKIREGMAEDWFEHVPPEFAAERQTHVNRRSRGARDSLALRRVASGQRRRSRSRTIPHHRPQPSQALVIYCRSVSP